MSVPHAQLLHQLHRLVIPAADDRETDADLVGRFVDHRDEAAFAALVRRHGPMVLNLCRRLIGDSHTTEDAFQATFLALARKAEAIHKPDALTAWLYGTARRIPLKARMSTARATTLADPVVLDSRPDPLSQVSAREVLLILDEEVQRLPEAYRLAVVLCCLDGRTMEEAARQLTCTIGAVRGRLDRGRKRLHDRLVRRGLTLAAALAVAGLSSSGIAVGGPALTATTVTAALAFADNAQSTVAPASEAARLAVDALGWTGIANSKLTLVLILALGVAALGAGAMVQLAANASKPVAGPMAVHIGQPEPARKDLHGDPLPAGAMNRLGTLRQRAPDSQIAVTADGAEIVAINSDLLVRRFDANTGELRATSQLPRSRSGQLWLSPRGSFALVVGTAGPRETQMELWDLAQKKRLRTLTLGKYSDPSGAAFSADEQRVAIADSALDVHRVLVWDWELEKSCVVWSEHKEIRERYYFPVVTLSSDGKRLAASHLDLTLRCWDADTGKLLWQSPHKNSHPFLFFRPGGRALVTMAVSHIGGSGISLWDADSGKPTQVTKLPKEAVYPVGASPDGRLLAFENGSGEMVLWEPGTVEPPILLPTGRPRGTHHVNPNQMPANFGFTPDGKGLVRRAGTLGRWNVTDGKPAFADTAAWGHTEQVTRLVFSPSGRLLASSAPDHTVRVWDVATSRTLHTLPKEWSDHLEFMPDGRHLLAVPFDLGKLVLQRWDLTTGQTAGGYALEDRKEFMVSSNVREVRVTADGGKIMMLTWKNGRAGDESVLTAWDAATGACLDHRRVPWREDSVLTPDGKRVLAFDSRSGEVRVLSVASGEVLRRFESDQQGRPPGTWLECDLALSPHGRMMASRVTRRDLDTGKTELDFLRVSDMETGRQHLTIPLAGPATFAFGLNNRVLAIAGMDGVRLWETASWREVGRIAVPGSEVKAQRPFVRSLAISPDGRTLATGHADSTILLWDAALWDGAKGGPLTPARAEVCWTDLAGADAVRGYSAVWQLAGDAQQALPLLKRLRGIDPAPAPLTRKLLADLDSDEFAVRQEAERKLQELGERAELALALALKGNPPLETSRRVEKLLAALKGSDALSGETLRAMRGVQILEAIGTAQARSLLEVLAGGVPNARLTCAAREALQRLKQRAAGTVDE